MGKSGFKKRRRVFKRRRPVSAMSHRKKKKYLKFALIAAGIIIAAAVLFVVLGKGNSSEPEPTPTPTAEQTEIADYSQSGVELILSHRSINDPFIYEDELLFSSGEPNKSNPELKNISSVDLTKEEKKAVQLEGVECKYTNIFEPKGNDKYIVFIDSNSKGGGRICVYERESKKTYSLRDYYYSMPHISICGKYAVFAVQTGMQTDKLYLCDLETKEVVLIQEFISNSSIYGGVCLTEEELIWSQTTAVSTEMDQKSSIHTLNLATGEIKETDPKRFVYSPLKTGDMLFFLDAAPNEQASLYMIKGEEEPKKIATNVINFALGSGYVAYTEEEAVHLYFYVSGKKASMNSKNSRGILSSAYDDMICWYDITDGFFERDVVKYASILNLEIIPNASIGKE